MEASRSIAKLFTAYVFYFFVIPPIKLKLRLKIARRLLIANHLEQ
jgi:hypothetical protein